MKRKLIILGLAFAALLPAWQDRGPSFEVAEIKPSDPSVLKPGKGRMLPGGQVAVPGYTLRELIMFTYGVTDEMISGGPKWVAEERYDIVAKAPAGAPDDALRAMMTALLRDRFKLATHREDKPMSAYVLTAMKSGAPLQESSASGASQCHWTDLGGGMRRRECQNLTMAEFAKDLPHTGCIGIQLPVSDQTGLTGRYDFQFEVGMARRPADASAPPDPFDTEGPNIFAALQKIGLHLENRKIPIPAMVIDSAERPSAN
jgi:uncharacterized protein (TIGR03435 family)